MDLVVCSSFTALVLLTSSKPLVRMCILRLSSRGDGMSSISGPSGYELVPLRVGADFTLYRGREHRNPSSVLAIAPSVEQPLPETLLFGPVPSGRRRRTAHLYRRRGPLAPGYEGISGGHSCRVYALHTTHRAELEKTRRPKAQNAGYHAWLQLYR
jgi:hypothetical protein